MHNRLKYRLGQEVTDCFVRRKTATQRSTFCKENTHFARSDSFAPCSNIRERLISIASQIKTSFERDILESTLTLRQFSRYRQRPRLFNTGQDPAFVHVVGAQQFHLLLKRLDPISEVFIHGCSLHNAEVLGRKT